MKHFNAWAQAIKKASSSSPLKCLHLYSLMHRQSVPVDSFSILFALKSCTLSNVNSSVIHHLHAHLLKLGFSAHVYVATSLLHAYGLRNFNDARILFDQMPVRNTVTWNVIITGYSRRGEIKNAHFMFLKIPSKTLSSWSVIIAGYMENSLCDQGLALFREMVSDPYHLKPDELVLCSVLSGCGRVGSAGVMAGKSSHGFATKNGWRLNVELGTCVVDMYSKCGLLNHAKLVFNMMNEVNVVAWTALICGAAKHGYCQEALAMFKKMKLGNVQPNELTFTGILTACARAGLVDEGRRYFNMVEECGLTRRIQHYSCMVELLGKTGRLDEAYEVISTMTMEPNVVIWGSFLSCCKLHRRFDMAEKVVDRVMRMARAETDGGVYSVLCDLYALNGQWREAESLRKVMVYQNVRKARGSSFIAGGIVRGMENADNKLNL